MSRRFGAHETAVTAEASTPPSDSQPPQEEPSHQRWYSAWSVPRAKMSRRFVAHETTRAWELSTPPSDSQPPQLAPSRSGKTLSLERVTGVPWGICRCKSAANGPKASDEPVRFW